MNYFEERREMVERLKKYGYLKDEKIEKAMLKVKREFFVLPEYREDAYVDTPLPIPGNATISAPHMHCIYLHALELKEGDKVLEVGFGSGILLAYIKEIVGRKGKVIGIEINPETFEFGKVNLKKAGYKDIKLILGDGSKGLEREAPFDKILISAACPEIPKPLIEELKPKGILIAPVGGISGGQELIRIRKNEKIKKENLGSVIFLPLIGKYGFRT
ncbi:MAG: protein-L-isoaspartate(D-aspartate) O-methyltransferase [Candidatus Aenigmatarchaeota archaeon]